MKINFFSALVNGRIVETFVSSRASSFISHHPSKPPPLLRLHESVIALEIIIISALQICIREIKKLFPLLPNET